MDNPLFQCHSSTVKAGSLRVSLPVIAQPSTVETNKLHAILLLTCASHWMLVGDRAHVDSVFVSLVFEP